jgi:hypothetical protein
MPGCGTSLPARPRAYRKAPPTVGKVSKKSENNPAFSARRNTTRQVGETT